MSEAVRLLPSSVEHAPEAIHALLAEMRKPTYMRLLGKAAGLGIGVGVIGRRVPAIAMPAALIAGIYLGVEIAAYVAESDREALLPSDAIDARSEDASGSLDSGE